MFFQKLLTGSAVIRKSVIDMWFRFPVMTILTIVGAVVSYILAADRTIASEPDYYLKILLLINLGAPYLILATLLSERYALVRFKALLIQIAGVAALVIYHMILPDKLVDISYIHAARIGLFTLIGYVAVFSAPLFLRPSKDLWIYGSSIVRRLVLAALFGITVWVGLALAFTAIHYLFELHFDLGTLLLKIWTIDSWILGVWVVLGGFPKTDELPESRLEMSRAIRWLLQYVLVPLASIFFLILYAYLIKIIVTWNWPMGGVAQWILGFSGFGIALFVATYPLQEKEGFTWLKIFFRWFFILLIPMTVVLFMAVGFRLKNYGITEERYMIVAGGLWLLFMAAYYLLNKKKLLHAIPYSLAVVFVFVSVAPWFNMFSLSVTSQVSRLRVILENNQVLVNGKIEKEAKDIKLPYADGVSASSIISFLSTRDSLNKIQPWFGVKLTTTSYTSARALLGLEESSYSPDSRGDQNLKYFSYFRPEASVTVVTGYDYILNNIYLAGIQDDNQILQYITPAGTVELKLHNGKVSISLGDKAIGTFDISRRLEELLKTYKLTTPPSKDFEMMVEDKAWRAKIFLNTVGGNMVNGKDVIQSLEVTLLLDKK